MYRAPAACPLCAAAPVRFFVRAERVIDYWRCPVCALIFRAPQQWPTRAAEHAYYQLHDNRPDDPGYRAYLRPLFDALQPQLAAGAEGLDFGCGPGSALAAMLVEAGHPMQLWDPLFAPDTTPLTRQYDFVTASEVMEHLHAPLSVLKQIDTLLAPGSRLGILTGFPPPSPDDFAAWHYRRDLTHVVFYAPETLSWIAQQFGWKLTLDARNVAVFTKPAH